jgi:hypothetical protein
MSAKSQRKKQAYEALKDKVPTPPAYEQPPAVPLPIFNTEELSSEAIEREPVKYLITCPHLAESRKDLNSDFYGYFEKHLVVRDGETIGCAFVKSCHECAATYVPSKNIEVVARVEYEMLSDHTLKAKLKNPGALRMVPTSDHGKKLAAEAAAEGPSTIH